jgi:hypothetical protein
MKRNILIVSLIILLCACSKQDEWLDKKSNKADIVPKTLADFQALMDNDTRMNTQYPSLAIIGSDNIYMPLDVWQARANASERNAYLWKADLYEGEVGSDYINSYMKVAYSNIVLEGLEIIPDKTSGAYNLAKGSALFYRAFAFYALAAEFALPYTADNLNKPGIALREETDVNKIIPRSAIKATYDKIIGDLLTALPLLPDLQVITTRPSKAAVYGVLARVYLAMEDYANAYDSANKALQLQSSLINFNTLSKTATYPFPTYQAKNPEVIFYATGLNYGSLSTTNLQVPLEFYNQYASADLRKTLFYNSIPARTTFKGYYSGLNGSVFYGVATNELFLIRAEAAARGNKILQAMSDLNTLLKTRWSASATYVDLTATNETEALQHILRERRKELPYTATLRWEDLKRLNRDSRFAVTLTRVHDNVTYTLPPNDRRYVLPFPDDEILLNGITQNER